MKIQSKQRKKRSVTLLTKDLDGKVSIKLRTTRGELIHPGHVETHIVKAQKSITLTKERYLPKRDSCPLCAYTHTKHEGYGRGMEMLQPSSETSIGISPLLLGIKILPGFSNVTLKYQYRSRWEFKFLSRQDSALYL